jgi:cytochrome b subunit of formate dehydrogenase
MADKIIYAMYDDDDALLDGAKMLVSKGIHVNEVFSPMPIHGIDDVIGVRHTRLGIASFLYGLTGLMLATLGMKYFMIDDWMMNIGGKPSFSYLENLPAFIPITFEFTVLCAAHGMAITYLLRNKTLPGMPASNPDPRTTDDMFVMEIRTSENTKYSAGELQALVKSTSIVELDEKTV